MTEPEFKTQMQRLITTWPNVYSTERVAVIWQEVRGFSPHWFKRVVDRFIGESRQAPLMAEFRDEISRERERTWFTEKKQNAQDAKEFFELSESEGKSIADMIKKRAMGGVSDPEWATFIESLDQLNRVTS